MNTQNTKLC